MAVGATEEYPITGVSVRSGSLPNGAAGEEVQAMAALKDDYEDETIERLAINAEVTIEADDARKDLKERRGIIKQTLFDGSKKLKHLVPKGKHL